MVNKVDRETCERVMVDLMERSGAVRLAWKVIYKGRHGGKTKKTKL